MKRVLFIILLPMMCYSQTVYNYVILRSSITKIISENTLKNYGYKSSDLSMMGGQPFRITQYILPDNTKYALISIAPKPAQWAMMKNIVSGGYAILISTYDVDKKWNDKTQNLDTIAINTPVSKLPKDFWRVIISTP